MRLLLLRLRLLILLLGLRLLLLRLLVVLLRLLLLGLGPVGLQHVVQVGHGGLLVMHWKGLGLMVMVNLLVVVHLDLMVLGCILWRDKEVWVLANEMEFMG